MPEKWNESPLSGRAGRDVQYFLFFNKKTLWISNQMMIQGIRKCLIYD